MSLNGTVRKQNFPPEWFIRWLEVLEKQVGSKLDGNEVEVSLKSRQLKT